jgi:hypothetical protein
MRVMTNVPRPDPVFLGYIVKRVVTRPGWLEAPTVELVCSVSNCFSQQPDSKLKLWGFNSAACYDSEPEAIATVDPALRPRFTRMALDYFALEFDQDGVRPMPAATFFGAEPLAEPRPPEYAFLGYDAASGRKALPRTNNGPAIIAAFDCSPLSCNSEAPRFAVNRFCLIEAWDEAVRAATTFGREAPEPGPYYILGVYAAQPIVPNDPEPPPA